ncbi:S41 family peptidase [Caenispirillum salinarum]|uniref:S41 family peptidase n=1 Tax=Caenispirillum salinarum TaxID=859058 RepID=UPI0038500E77
MVRSSLIAGLALGLAAVLPAGAPATAAAPAAATPAPVAPFATEDADFGETATLLRRGFQAIHDRAIEPRTIPELALAGLAGLSTIDPAVAVAVEDGAALLSVDGLQVLGAPLPEGDVARAWAGMVAVVAREMRHHSHALAAAGLEAIHEAIIDAALEGMDAHSRYDSPEDAEKQRSRRNGFSGIGVRYVRDGGPIRIKEVMAEGPSDGILRPGDLITHADGTALADLELAEMSRRLRGPRHTEVALTVLRADGPAQDVTIVRDRVVPPSVEAEVRDGVAVVRVRRFNVATTASVRDAVQDALAAEPRLAGAVLDLRGNPGGLLDQAYGVADLFLEGGPIVSTRGRHPGSMQSYTAGPGDLLKGRPLVVLVDGRSASSSEILAAALKDSGRAMLVGTNSYGKGTVQTIVRLPNQGELKLTWSRFHSPAGYAIQGLGVMPSLCLSGVAEPLEETDAGGFIPAAANTASIGSPVAEAVEARWETVPLDAEAERNSLRGACARENRTAMGTDIDVALELIRDAGLQTQHATLKP